MKARMSMKKISLVIKITLKIVYYKSWAKYRNSNLCTKKGAGQKVTVTTSRLDIVHMWGQIDHCVPGSQSTDKT